MHVCVRNLTIIASDNGLAPGWRQATIWTSAGMLLIGPSGANFSEILIENFAFSFNETNFENAVHETVSILFRPQCVNLLDSCESLACLCLVSQQLSCVDFYKNVLLFCFYTPCFNKVERGEYWFHVVHLSVRPSVLLWTESCPLCNLHNTGRIHFIFTHLGKQLQEMCRV